MKIIGILTKTPSSEEAIWMEEQIKDFLFAYNPGVLLLPAELFDKLLFLDDSNNVLKEYSNEHNS